MDILNQVAEIMEAHKLASVEYESGDIKIKMEKAMFRGAEAPVDEMKENQEHEEDQLMFWSAT